MLSFKIHYNKKCSLELDYSDIQFLSQNFRVRSWPGLVDFTNRVRLSHLDLRRITHGASKSSEDTWSEVTTTGDGPTAKGYGIAFYDEANDRLLVHGGDPGGFNGIDEMHALDLAMPSEVGVPEGDPVACSSPQLLRHLGAKRVGSVLRPVDRVENGISVHQDQPGPAHVPAERP